MKKPTVLELSRRKGERMAMLTAYDYPSARLVAEAGVDLILVGDSLGMVVLGYDSTTPVTLADMVHHTRAARRGAPDAFLIADLPFLSYGTLEQALESSARLMKEAGADSVKLEGGAEVGPLVEGLVRAGVPLPLASVANARSMIYVGNLASAVERALSVSTYGTFLVSDDADLSTPELVRRLGAAMGRPARLFACPPRLLRLLGGALGKGDEVTRMLESLRVDCSEIKQRLQWSIPFTVEHGLQDTVQWFARAGAAA